MTQEMLVQGIAEIGSRATKDLAFLLLLLINDETLYGIRNDRGQNEHSSLLEKVLGHEDWIGPEVRFACSLYWSASDELTLSDGGSSLGPGYIKDESAPDIVLGAIREMLKRIDRPIALEYFGGTLDEYDGYGEY